MVGSSLTFHLLFTLPRQQAWCHFMGALESRCSRCRCTRAGDHPRPASGHTHGKIMLPRGACTADILKQGVKPLIDHGWLLLLARQPPLDTDKVAYGSFDCEVLRMVKYLILWVRVNLQAVASLQATATALPGAVAWARSTSRSRLPTICRTGAWWAYEWIAAGPGDYTVLPPRGSLVGTDRMVP